MPKGYECIKKVAGFEYVLDSEGNKTDKILCKSFNKNLTQLVKAVKESKFDKGLTV